MKAAMFVGTRTSDGKHLSIEDIPRPKVLDGHLLLKVIACGVCRTDLHIVEGDLTPLRHFAHPSLLNMQATRYDRSVCQGRSKSGPVWRSKREPLWV
jgi:hypothetical protein